RAAFPASAADSLPASHRTRLFSTALSAARILPPSVPAVSATILLRFSRGRRRSASLARAHHERRFRGTHNHKSVGHGPGNCKALSARKGGAHARCYTSPAMYARKLKADI